jgi:hypothetical protein
LAARAQFALFGALTIRGNYPVWIALGCATLLLLGLLTYHYHAAKRAAWRFPLAVRNSVYLAPADRIAPAYNAAQTVRLAPASDRELLRQNPWASR